MRKIMVLAASAVAAMAVPASAASILSDGSFDAQGAAALNGSGASYCYFNGAAGAPTTCGVAPSAGGASGTPWSGNSGLIASGSGPWGSTAAADGGFYSFVQGTGNLSQTATAASAGNHLLTWSDHGRTNNGGPQTYEVFVNGTSLGTFSGGADWTGRSAAVALPTGSFTLNFQGNVAQDVTSFIDNVSLTAVPEPTTWAMMIAGYGFIGGAMRRRRATTAAFA